jgi:hypothetical protein
MSQQFPPYSYVPGGRWPHPKSDPAGHSFGKSEFAAGSGEWLTSSLFQEATELFNNGFYWEAHEAWETLWHAAGRKGPVADFLKALIKMAAAGVKVREGRLEGVRTHAMRAAAIFRQLPESASAELSRFDLKRLEQRAVSIATETILPPPECREMAVLIVFDWQLSK